MKENFKLAMVQKLNKKMSGSTDSYKLTEIKRKETKDASKQRLGGSGTHKSEANLAFSYYNKG